MTEEDFKRIVKERTSALGFLRALYVTLEEFQIAEREQTGMVVACGQGCSQCCNQMVCVFPLEMRGVQEYVSKLASPTRRTLRERARPVLEGWNEWLSRTARFSPQYFLDPLNLHRTWLGKPCPLVQEDGSCGVYEARPLVCRTTTSPERCTLVNIGDGQHSRQMRLECEQWANDLLFEFIEENKDVIQVSPVHSFLSMGQFKL